MSKVLMDITELIEKIDVSKVPQPEMPALPTDHVVGVMSEDLRKIFGVWRDLGSRAEALSDRIKRLVIKNRHKPEAPPEVQKLLDDLLLLGSRVSVLDELFWCSVRHEFGALAGKPALGVRKGWKVVWTEEVKGPTINLYISLGNPGRTEKEEEQG